MENLSALLKKAQQGDKSAYGQIYGIFYKRIYRYCFFNQRNEQQAQDTCQETFLRAWKNIDSFSEKRGGSFQAFLFRIARNLIIDESRKKKVESINNYYNIESVDETEENIDKKSDSAKLKFALSKLNEKDRQIIILRYFEEMTTSEVAKSLNSQEGAIRVRIHRILKNLREKIE